MDGVLVVNKPKGITSHDVVDFIRKRFGFKKVGHAGTLDPMATGVLIILIGKATKSSNEFMASDKEYEATLTLGARSDTGDAWGKIVGSESLQEISRERIDAAFNKFLGDIEQRPPMYSAVKVKGKKLYELARKGLTVEVQPRKISIGKLEILDVKLPDISFRMTCSKGTYVRQLCVDIGEELGCGGYLSKLVRTRSGKFTLGDAIDLEKIKELSKEEMGRKVLAL